MLHAIINCKSYEFRETGSILEAARAIALDIPTLCHDERLKPAGACRCAWLKSKDGFIRRFPATRRSATAWSS
jgi:formate dehydrogenase major subunit